MDGDPWYVRFLWYGPAWLVVLGALFAFLLARYLLDTTLMALARSLATALAEAPWTLHRIVRRRVWRGRGRSVEEADGTAGGHGNGRGEEGRTDDEGS